LRKFIFCHFWRSLPQSSWKNLRYDLCLSCNSFT